MKTTTNVINTEFRAFSVTNRYPFTSNSSLYDVNGRNIPTSVFIDAIIYPNKKVENAYISRIFLQEDSLCIELSSNDGVLGYAYNVHEGTNYFISGQYFNHPQYLTINERVIGNIVLSGGVNYLLGLAKIHELVFSSNGLAIDPSRIVIIENTPQKFVVNGVAIQNNKNIVLQFSSDRFTIDNGALNYDITVDTNTIATPIYSINNLPINSKQVWVYSAKRDDSDIRVLTEKSKLTLLKIGDD